MELRPFAETGLRAMTRWPVLIIAAVCAVLVHVGSGIISKRPFPSDRTPEGAYARIALSIAERRPRDAFAYLETEAQWASFSILELRKKACDRVRASYPADAKDKVIAPWKDEADALDGADLFARLAERRGWVTRLERDLSGSAQVDIQGERATVVTGRGTRYPFRLRNNGIWGLTIFTAELQAEAERAARDLDIIKRAAADYDGTKVDN